MKNHSPPCPLSSKALDPQSEIFGKWGLGGSFKVKRFLGEGWGG